MRQTVGAPGLSGLAAGLGSRLPDLVHEALRDVGVPDGVHVSFGGFEPRTCQMHFDVSGKGIPFGVLSQVTTSVAAKIGAERSSRPARNTHLNLVRR